MVGYKKYKTIIDYYKKSFIKNGFTYKALKWKSIKKNNLRFSSAFQFIKKKSSILDFGCGTSLFYKFLNKKKIKIKYYGIDTSPEAINYCNKKFISNTYYCADIFDSKTNFNNKFDYVFANGIFTLKINLSDSEMKYFLKSALIKLFSITKKSLIFNLLSEHVDWKNRQNYYPKVSEIISIIKKNLSSHFVIDHNYDKFEYMVKVDKK
jgi:SAM-dependent methyltransferase